MKMQCGVRHIQFLTLFVSLFATQIIQAVVIWPVAGQAVNVVNDDLDIQADTEVTGPITVINSSGVNKNVIKKSSKEIIKNQQTTCCQSWS